MTCHLINTAVMKQSIIIIIIPERPFHSMLVSGVSAPCHLKHIFFFKFDYEMAHS